MADNVLPYKHAPWGPWIGVPKERQLICAVIGCKVQGVAHPCPADDGRHHHGCVHYQDAGEELYNRHRLMLRTGWGLLCKEHYVLISTIINEQRGPR